MPNVRWADFSFRDQEPWERMTSNRMEMLRRRGQKALTPGAGRRRLMGLPDDMVDQELEDTYMTNQVDLAQNEQRRDQRNRGVQARDNEAYDRTGNPFTNAEDMLWEQIMGQSAPSTDTTTFTPRPKPKPTDLRGAIQALYRRWRS